MDLNAIAELFSEDCVVEFGPDDQLNSCGPKAVAKSLERMWRWERTSHHLSNVSIHFNGSYNASSISYVHAWHERPDKTTATIFGQYHDELRRENDRWVITKRTMFMNGSDSGFTVNIFPFKRKTAPKNWISPKIDKN
jgi:ketosteroid isomerase-like protein